MLALIFLVSVFLLPITAFANAPPESEQTEAAQTNAPPSSAETEQTGTPPSPPMGTDQGATSPQPTPPPSSQSPWAERPPTGNSFTPDGTATVVDNATSDDGKEFFTFTTPEGNVFFLIIDRNRPNNNVYFLNAVTEQDLMALAEDSAEPPTFAPHPEPLPPTSPPEITDDPPEPDPPSPANGNNGTMVFVGAAAIVFGGAAYYLKIVRPKKQGAGFDEDYDEYEDEDDFDEDEDEGYEEIEENYDVDEIIREVRESEPVKSKPMIRQTTPTQGDSTRSREAPPDRASATADAGERDAHDGVP